MAYALEYYFEFSDSKNHRFELNFDERHTLQANSNEKSADWTRLEANQCPHCPLKKDKCAYCPIARNLQPVINAFKGIASYIKVKVTVTTPERTCIKDCDAQTGLRSLFGLIMASSGCPHLDWLRPLARFHLPFASLDENLFRVISLQLLEDYLKGNFKELANCSERVSARYQAVENVNHAFIERLRLACSADAERNALSALDIFVQFFPYHLESDFSPLRAYFT